MIIYGKKKKTTEQSIKLDRTTELSKKPHIILMSVPSQIKKKCFKRKYFNKFLHIKKRISSLRHLHPKVYECVFMYDFVH